MKYRAGFVTNSSSSSYLVAFEKAPQTLDDLLPLIDPDKIDTQYYDYREKYADKKDEVADIVMQAILDEISGKSPIDPVRLRALNLINPDLADDLQYEEEDIYLYDENLNGFPLKGAEEFVAANPGKQCFHVRFSDECGNMGEAILRGQFSQIIRSSVKTVRL